jgi:hypothetical protein
LSVDAGKASPGSGGAGVAAMLSSTSTGLSVREGGGRSTEDRGALLRLACPSREVAAPFAVAQERAELAHHWGEAPESALAA